MNIYNICYSIAKKAHYRQFRRDNVTPYIEHPKRVAKRVEKYGDIYKSVAILHDVLEDTFYTADLLRLEHVPDNIVDAVILLSKLPTTISYDDYIKTIKSNEMARIVKINDIIDNLSDSPTDKQIRKYAAALLILSDI
jgi:(p)ppGpp synthase/HD superfamily hydrolase